MLTEISADHKFRAKTGPFNLGVINAEVGIMDSPPELNQLIVETSNSLAADYRLDEVNKIENIAHTRSAYKKLGNDPNRYRPSADALIRRIVKGMGIYPINNVVDVLNLTSIRDGYSISGFNRAMIQGKIHLGTGKVGEPFRGIGRGDVNIANLPVLRDAAGAFGNPTSDSERTMIGSGTKEILFVFYDFGRNPGLENSMENCRELLKEYCYAKETVLEVLKFG